MKPSTSTSRFAMGVGVLKSRNRCPLLKQLAKTTEQRHPIAQAVLTAQPVIQTAYFGCVTDSLSELDFSFSTFVKFFQPNPEHLIRRANEGPTGDVTQLTGFH